MATAVANAKEAIKIEEANEKRKMEEAEENKEKVQTDSVIPEGKGEIQQSDGEKITQEVGEEQSTSIPEIEDLGSDQEAG